MAEIRVEQKRSAKWMYVVAILVVLAVWYAMAQRNGRNDELNTPGMRAQDSVGTTMPPATGTVPPPQ